MYAEATQDLDSQHLIEKWHLKASHPPYIPTHQGPSDALAN